MKSPEEIKEVLKPLEGCGLYYWVAGNSIVSFFLGKKIQEVNIYFQSSKDRSAAEGYLFSKGYKTIKRLASGSKMRKGNSVIDLLFSKKTPEETLKRFDFSIACAAIDSNGTFYCHESFFQDMEEKNLNYTGNQQNMGSYSFKNKSLRLLKYMNQGFSIKNNKNMIFWLKKLNEDQEQIKQNRIPKIKEFNILKMC
tara:strand:- start:2505 stop:3092 length:588 start_codon:yes stop_codon:yes gene_type:complete